MKIKCEDCNGTGIGEIAVGYEGQPEPLPCRRCMGSGIEIPQEDLDYDFDRMMDGRRHVFKK